MSGPLILHIYADLAEGDAHVIRNAGGRASDKVFISLVPSYEKIASASATNRPM